MRHTRNPTESFYGACYHFNLRVLCAEYLFTWYGMMMRMTRETPFEEKEEEYRKYQSEEDSGWGLQSLIHWLIDK